MTQDREPRKQPPGSPREERPGVGDSPERGQVRKLWILIILAAAFLGILAVYLREGGWLRVFLGDP